VGGRVEIVRGGILESSHQVHAAVVRADGSLLAFVGDPGRLTILRSAAKPFQARVFLRETDAVRDDVLAVMCASHEGLPMHVEAVQRGLAAYRLDARRLENDPSLPASERLRQQCSGTHMGFLAAAKAHGWPLAGYCDRDHPSQQAAHEELALAARRPTDRIPVVVDACGLATFALPLQVIAALYARLPRSDPRQYAAMRAFPDLVAGPRRFDSRLMHVVPGAVAKLGAEGLEAVCLAHEELGIAVRVEDGDSGNRAVVPAALAILPQLLDLDLSPLDDLAAPKLTPLGRGRREIGSVTASIDLEFSGQR
jgi:L-asparaginase II